MPCGLDPAAVDDEVPVHSANPHPPTVIPDGAKGRSGTHYPDLSTAEGADK
jgi:hypothetical protein